MVHSILKQGWPLLLGDKMDEQAKCYVRNVREKGRGIDTTVLIIACAEAMVKESTKSY